MYQVPYTQNHHPTHGHTTPEMMFDTHGAPLTYKTPQGVFNNGHQVPMGYYGCCNYPYVPGYFNPPYPHYPPPPPPPFYYHGAYPSLPPMYPVHYPPPPHYPNEQPRYEFDKTDHHCCGCHGHQCNRKEDPHVKIDRQEPDIEKSPSESLLPVEPRSHSYPLVLVPQEYMNSREHRNNVEPEKSEQQSSDPRIGNNVETAGKGNQTQKELGRNLFPFPIFWVPYEGLEEGEKHHKELDLSGIKENNIMMKPEEESEARVGTDDGPVEMKKISNQKLIPMKRVGENEEKRDKDMVKEKGDKENKLKLIPVRQGGENGEKSDKDIVKDSGNKEHKLKLIPVRQGGENGEKKDKEIVKEKGERKNKLSENVSKSKLPPVCLRVEPLRKRKNESNGNSRSPSPKRDENKSIQNEVNELKSTTEGVKKDIELVDGKAKENEKEDARVDSSKERKENDEKLSMEEKTNEEIKFLEKTEEGEMNVIQKVEKGRCELKTEARKKLSEFEAALTIQSAYRGFEVRRWDPLKKLKQIGGIREKMAEITSQIEALEASTDSCSCDKQRLVIGETVMGLLLKLDTVQGLHPSVREIRKSVAKELVSLQDRLDSLAKKSSPSSTAQLEESPIQAPHRAEVGGGNILEASQAAEQTVVETICAEAKGGKESVPSVCRLNNEGTKEDISSLGGENLKDENESSIKNMGEVQDDPWNKEGMIAQTNNAEHVMDAGSAPEEAEREIGEGAKDEVGPVSAVCLLKDEEVMKEIVPGFINPLEQEGSSVEHVGESRNDLCNNEMKVTEIDDTEPERNADVVSEDKVSSHADDISTDQPGVQDGEYSIEEDKCEQIPLQMCEELLGPDSKSPLIDVADSKEVTTVTEEPQGSLDECNSNSLSVDLEDEMKLKMDSKSDDFLRVEEEKVPEEVQGGELHKSLGDFVESLNAKEDYIEKQEICMEVQEDQKGKGTKIAMDTSFESDPELEQPRPEPLGTTVEVPKAEEIDGDEADAKLEKMGEIYGVENGSNPEEMKGCATELEIAPAEEKHESRENKYVVAVENIQNIKKVGTAETLDLEKQVEIASEKGVESDDKLVEENEKLKEMVAKLVEAGKEQLSVISSLSGRVRELETKLVRNKKKPKMRRIRVGSSCTKPSDRSVKASVEGVSV